MALKKLNKLYYSIGEVSQITNLKQYVLRYWETEFPVLSPTKNTAGNRIYKNNDIKLIKYIQDLLYNKKFTIKGAKQHLEHEYGKSNSPKKAETVTLNAILTRDELKNIRKSLTDIIALIDDYKK
tara:strand:- start:68 stop:442 length:375 start_codon:yes stop_codon:yes gene_type:complete